MARFVRISSPLDSYKRSSKNVDSTAICLMDIPERMNEESLQARLKQDWKYKTGSRTVNSKTNRIRVTGDGLFFSADPIQSFYDEEWDW